MRTATGGVSLYTHPENSKLYVSFILQIRSKPGTFCVGESSCLSTLDRRTGYGQAKGEIDAPRASMRYDRWLAAHVSCCFRALHPALYVKFYGKDPDDIQHSILE